MSYDGLDNKKCSKIGILQSIKMIIKLEERNSHLSRGGV